MTPVIERYGIGRGSKRPVFGRCPSFDFSISLLCSTSRAYHIGQREESAYQLTPCSSNVIGQEDQSNLLFLRPDGLIYPKQITLYLMYITIT